MTDDNTYTPSTDAIRKVYAAAPIITEANRLGTHDIDMNMVRFNRWLSAHDAVVRAKAQDDVLREAIDTELEEAGFTVSLERLAKRREEVEFDAWASRKAAQRWVDESPTDTGLVHRTPGRRIPAGPWLPVEGGEA